MKTELKTKEIKNFKPFTVELTFESMEEVLEMYARVNVNAREIGGGAWRESESLVLDVGASTGLYDILDEYLEENDK